MFPQKLVFVHRPAALVLIAGCNLQPPARFGNSRQVHKHSVRAHGNECAFKAPGGFAVRQIVGKDSSSGCLAAWPLGGDAPLPAFALHGTGVATNLAGNYVVRGGAEQTLPFAPRYLAA